MKEKQKGRKLHNSNKAAKQQKTSAKSIEVAPAVSAKKTILTFLLLTSFCSIFFLVGIKWGQPSSSSWNPDSQVGSWGLFHYKQLGTNEWTSKYPKGQPYITAPFYRYYTEKFSNSPVKVVLPDGRTVITDFDEYRFGKVIMASRYITALMAALAVWAMYLSGKLLFNDYWAGVLTALASLLSIDFVYHAHLGNFDVPSTFWYAWGLYTAIRIVYTNRWRDYIAYGFCLAYGFCTKDSVGGYFFGLSIAIWLTMTLTKKKQLNLSWFKASITIFNYKTLAAAIVAILTFAVLSDLLVNPSLFFTRMKHWVGGEGVTNFNQAFQGHLWLLQKAFISIYYAMGFPMLTAMLIGLFYCMFKCPKKILFPVIPFITFYVFIVMPIEMTVARYYIPGIFALSLLTGKLFSDMLKYRKIPKFITFILIIAVYGMSAIYCFGICLEMRTDTRYRAEQWLSQNITNNNTIICGLDQKAYMPRIKMAGFDRHFYYRAKDMDTLRKISLHAEYIIARPSKIRGYKLDIESLGYEQVARFGTKYIAPRKTIFSLCSQPYGNQNFVSRPLIIYKKLPKLEAAHPALGDNN